MSEGFAGNERFLVRGQLGIGGMGVVHEAIDLERNVRVAIKTLRLDGAKRLLRFKNEFRSLRDIKHPNLVELGELFEEDGTWFFTMELLEGVDFLTYVRADESEPWFDEARLRHALVGLGAGLSALHRADKVHCDVKPANVLVTEAGRVVLLDFGVVTELSLDNRSGRNPRAGSPLYMAPEQAAGRPVGPKSDWYSFGALLFEGLTGDVPFRGRTHGEVLKRKQHEAPPHPSDRRSGLPPDLADVCFRLLACEPHRRPDEGEILTILGVNERTSRSSGLDLDAGQRIFVGRKQALDELDGALEQALHGRAVSVFVEGESGVGKSVLLEHFIDGLVAGAPVARTFATNRRRTAAERSRAATRPYVESRSRTAAAWSEGARATVVFRGQCHEREFMRYNAFDGVFDGIARFLRSSLIASEVIASVTDVGPLLHLFPVLRNVRGLSQRDEPVSGDVRRRGFAAASQLLDALAQRMLLVVLIDDIHWADADSLALMQAVVRARNGPTALFLASARYLDDGSSCPAIEAVGGDIRRIALAGLEHTEAVELATVLFERAGDARALNVDRVIAETGGHPLFMDELVRYAARHRQGASALTGAHLDEALRDRIAELDDDTQRILQIVAVAGAAVSYDIAAKTSLLSAQVFEAGLSILRRGNLVRMHGRDRYALINTYHDRMREAVYARLPTELRGSLHFQLARVMESRGVDPLRLATHFHRGGRPEEARRYALEAAREANRATAFEQAAALYQLALDTMTSRSGSQRSGVDIDLHELRCELGLALQNAGRTREAAQAYLHAAEDAEGLEWLSLHGRAAQQLLIGGYMEQGVAVVREVLAHSGIKLPKSGRRALPSVAWNFFQLQRHDLTWQRPTPEEMASPAFHMRATRIDVCWSAAGGLSLVDTLRGIFFSTRSARMSLKLGEPFRVARSLCTTAVSAAALGNKAASYRLLDAVARAAEQDGGPYARFYEQTARFVLSFFFEQQWGRCVELGQSLEGIWKEAGYGHGFEMDFVVQFLSWSLSMYGDIEVLTSFVDSFVADTRRVGNRLLNVALRVYHSLIYLAADDPQRAALDVQDAISSWLPGNNVFHLMHAWAIFSQASVLLYQGDPFAEEELTAELRRLRQSPLYRTRWILWQDQYVRGRLALARASVLAAERHKRRVIDEVANVSAMAKRLDKAVSPIPQAWAALLHAGCAQVTGNSERALASLKVAHDGFVVTESGLHAAAALYRIGQTIGGEQGRSMMDRAFHDMRARAITRPERLAGLLAPGWP